jgi:hypothetical protein
MQVQRSATRADSVVIPNGTARDHGISFTARGILAYVLSLTDGRSVSIKGLAAESSEGQRRIAAALRELEAAGYLTRSRVRGANGRVTSRVVWSDLREVPAAGAEPQVAPDLAYPGPGDSGLNPLGGKDKTSPPTPLTVVTSESAPEGREGGEMTRSQTFLASLGQADPKLHLGQGDIRELSPLVDQWFGLGADERLVRVTLTAGLPGQISHPAGLLRKRLVEKMPTVPLAAPVRPAQSLGHECPECQRPTASVGLCKPCAETPAAPAATVSPVSWRTLARDYGPGLLAAA